MIFDASVQTVFPQNKEEKPAAVVSRNVRRP
jgi:hypothetical protein